MHQTIDIPILLHFSPTANDLLLRLQSRASRRVPDLAFSKKGTVGDDVESMRSALTSCLVRGEGVLEKFYTGLQSDKTSRQLLTVAEGRRRQGWAYK